MLKKFLTFTLALLMLLPSLTACVSEPDPYEGKLILAKDGVSDYQIVIPSSPTEAMRGAASELQNYFYAVSGATLPVVDDKTEPHTHEIILGKTTRNEGEREIFRQALGNEGFCIRNLENNFFIAGGADRGTLYGVYGFLEKYLGVRYWAEGEEYIPRTSVIALDPLTDDDIQKPGFEFRLQSHQSASSYNEKMHLNAAWSGDKQPIAGGIQYTGPWYVHTLGTLAGWKSSDNYCHQPCLTSTDVYMKVLENARKYLEENPKATVISISQNDSTMQNSGECECDNCKAEKEKYGSSGVMLRFVNRLANALKSTNSNIYVETLAYYYTQEPPKGGVTAADNVIVRFCNAAGCLMHSLDEEDPDAEAIYPKNNTIAYENFKGWKEAAKNLYVWEYNTNFGSSLSSIPNFKRLYENITTYYKYGATGIYVQGMRDSGEFDRLRGYLASKLLWNPEMSYEEYLGHMKEFLEGYYCGAGSEIAEYIEYITELCEDVHPSMYHDATRYLPMELTEDNTADTKHIKKLKKLYENAVANAENYKIELRVRRTLLPILYYETLLVAKELYVNGEGPERLVELNENLYNEMMHAEIQNLKEGLAMPKKPNFKNTALYWGWDGSGIFDEKSAEAHKKAKEEEKNKASA